jgi:hypothetical protein
MTRSYITNMYVACNSSFYRQRLPAKAARVRGFPGSNNSTDFFCGVTVYNPRKWYDNTSLAASFYVYPYYNQANKESYV